MRSRAKALPVVVSFAAFGGACASRANDLAMPGVSDKTPESLGHGRPMPSGSARELWEHASEIPTLVTIDERALPSRGHNPPFWSGVVRVSSSLEPAYRAPSPAMSAPPGAIVVEAHTSSTDEGAPTYAMTKREAGFDPRGGDWEYLVLDADGRVGSRGVLPLCARCHGDAPYDHLFGARLDTRRKDVAAGAPDGGIGAPDDDEGRAPDESMPANATPSKPVRSGRKKHGR